MARPPSGEGIACYDHPVATESLEGTNNKIKVVEQQAYGFRADESFESELLRIHETKQALVG